MFILAIIIPPLAVLLSGAGIFSFLFNIIFTLLGWIPGILHALFVVNSRNMKKEINKLTDKEPSWMARKVAEQEARNEQEKEEKEEFIAEFGKEAWKKREKEELDAARTKAKEIKEEEREALAAAIKEAKEASNKAWQEGKEKIDASLAKNKAKYEEARIKARARNKKYRKLYIFCFWVIGLSLLLILLSPIFYDDLSR